MKVTAYPIPQPPRTFDLTGLNEKQMRFLVDAVYYSTTCDFSDDERLVLYHVIGRI